MAQSTRFPSPSIRIHGFGRIFVLLSVFLAVSVQGRRLTAVSSPAVSCPGSAVRKCDFYFEGYEDTPPVISLDGSPDTGVGPRLLDSKTGASVQVGTTGQGAVVCGGKCGLTTAANQFYANGQEARIHIHKFNKPPKASFENLCVLLPLLAVQTNSLNLNPNDDNQAAYPDARRCVVFATGPSGACAGAPAGPPTPAPTSYPSPPLTSTPPGNPPPSPDLYTISPPPLFSPPSPPPPSEILDASPPPPSFSPPPPGKPYYPAMFAFGDSTLDIGNNNNLSLSPFMVNFLPYGIDYIPASGRFTNGKGFMDYLAELSRLTPVQKFTDLNSTSFDNFASGVNFASGAAGSLSSTNCLKNTYCTDFPTQLAQFTNLSAQYSEETIAKSLIVISVGGNDYFAYLKNVSAYNVTEYITDVITSISDGIQTLYQAGARKFLLFEVGDMGCIPTILSAFNVSTLNPVCVPSVSLLVSAHNAALGNLVSSLGQILTDAHFITSKVGGFVTKAAMNPSAYGFVNGTSSCCGGGGIFNSLQCGLPGTTYCSNRDDYLFWDSVHLTQHALKLISEGVFTGNSSYVVPFGVEALSAY